MIATPTAIPEVIILEPKVFGDERGFFFESFNAKAFEQATGLKREFVQDNHSNPPSMSCAACITRSRTRKANLSASYRAKSSMSRLTSEKARKPLASGLAFI